MVLYFKNIKTKKNQPFEIKITGVLNSSNLHVVIIDETTCGLFNNSESDVYTQIHVRKINHIIYGNFMFESEKVYCKIGFITAPEGDLVRDPFIPIVFDLITHNGEVVQLEVDYSLHDIYFENMYVVNYTEYSEYCDLMGYEKHLFKEFIINLAKRKINNNTFNSYQLSPKVLLESNKFITNDAFNMWLDEQETLKSKPAIGCVK
jgi:hypothetical protein